MVWLKSVVWKMFWFLSKQFKFCAVKKNYIIKVIFSFDSAIAPKILKIFTGPINGCGTVWIWLYPLDYILKLPTILLVKVCFGHFRIFLRLCSLFTIFALQKPQVFKPKLLLFKNMQRFSTKLLVMLFLSYFGIFEHEHNWT